MIPASVGQAIFGGSFGYTFRPNLPAQVPLTLQLAALQSADAFDVKNSGASIVASIGATGAITGLQFNGSGAGLTTGTIPDAALVTAPVTSVSAGTGISSTGGTSPTIGLSHGDYCDTVSVQTCGGTKTFANILSATNGFSTPSSGNAFTMGNGAGGTNTTAFNANNASTISGVTDSVFGLAANGVASVVAVDASGNIGALGSVKAAGFNGSSLAAAQCVGTDASKNLVSNTNCQTAAISASAPITDTAGVIACATCLVNTYASISSTYSGLLTMASGSGTTNGGVRIGNSLPGSTDYVSTAGTCSGIAGTAGAFIVNGVGNALCISTALDVGVGRNLYAANFFNGSRREWKKNITPYAFDPISVLEGVDYAEFDCKDPRCGPNGTHKIGLIANDSPWQVAGKGHDHYDAFAMAAIDGAAIVKQQKQIKTLMFVLHALCLQPQNRGVAECAALSQ
jgi:hypothetical protein